MNNNIEVKGLIPEIVKKDTLAKRPSSLPRGSIMNRGSVKSSKMESKKWDSKKGIINVNARKSQYGV